MQARTTKAGANSVLAGARHPLLQNFRQAWRRGELTADGCCAVEGAHLVEEALRSRLEVVAVLAARSAEEKLASLAAAGDGRARLYVTSDRLFRSLAPTETPQGIAALVRLAQPRLEDQLQRPQAVAVALVGLQDPGNLGTILRALDAFGGVACLLAPNSVSPFNAKAVRASAGSLFRVPVFRHLEAERIFALCRRHGLRSVALTPRAPRRLGELDLRQPMVFFIGREGSGLPAELLEQAEATARIPLAASVESLNAAMAANLALYETARQRGFPS